MKRFILSALITLTLSAAAGAQTSPAPPKPADPHAGHDMTQHAGQPKQEKSAAAAYFTDVELLDQDGRKVRFYSDVLKGRTVVVNAFFTTCTAVCPPMNRNMEKIQDAFGDRLGKDIVLVSISVDPANDTPPRLKEYAARFHAKPGWMFLTGKKENVDWALYKLGQYVEAKDDHKTILIVGNEATGLWKKAFAMSNAADLIRIVQETAADKGGK